MALSFCATSPVPTDVIDEMARTVSRYIAGRGKLLHPQPGQAKIEVHGDGYIMTGIEREPALVPFFEQVHRSARVHRALSTLYEAPHGGHGDHGKTTSAGGANTEQAERERDGHNDRSTEGSPSKEGSKDAYKGASKEGYRYVHRNELSIDRAIDWHTDNVMPYIFQLGADSEWAAGYAPASSRRELVNVGIYLQDHTGANGSLPAFYCKPGTHLSPQQGVSFATTNKRAQFWALRPRRGDAVVFYWGMRHKGSYPFPRRANEPTVPVPHRAMLNIGYARDNIYGEMTARGFQLRDNIMYDNETYPCSYNMMSRCTAEVGERQVLDLLTARAARNGSSDEDRAILSRVQAALAKIQAQNQ